MNIGLIILNDPVIKKFREQFPADKQADALRKAMKIGITSLNMIQKKNLAGEVRKDLNESFRVSNEKKIEYVETGLMADDQTVKFILYEEENRKNPCLQDKGQLINEKMCMKKNSSHKKCVKMKAGDQGLRKKRKPLALDSYRGNKTIDLKRTQKKERKKDKISERTIGYMTSSSDS